MTTGHRLYVDAIDAMSIYYDWSGRNVEYDDVDDDHGWRIVLPDFNDYSAGDLARFFDDRGYEDEAHEAHAWAEYEDGESDEEPDARSLDDLYERARDICNDDNLYVPMMNYAYPLPNFRGDATAAQRTLDQLERGCAAIVVEIDGVPWLALAGGGMNLSWDICRAYIALGYYPPVHYAARLPRQGETDVETARLALESCEIAARWATQHVEDARALLTHTMDLASDREAISGQ